MVFCIAFMYLCAFGLAPFVILCMYIAFDGDRMREADARARVAAAAARAVPAPAQEAAAARLAPAGVTVDDALLPAAG